MRHRVGVAIGACALIVAACVAACVADEGNTFVVAPDGGAGDAAAPVDGGGNGTGDGAAPMMDAGGGTDAADGSTSLPTTPMIVVGDGDSCVLRKNGDVYCWGDNSCGNLGGGNTAGNTYTPFKVPLSAPAAQISAGEYFTCALLIDRTVSCWGENGLNQLGHLNSSDPYNANCEGGNVHYVASPTKVANLTDVIQISSGVASTCVRKTDSSVWCWGANDLEQLGHANTSDGDCQNVQCTPTPTQVSGIVASNISTSGLHTCAMTATGLFCWGYNDNGELGHPQNTNGDIMVNNAYYANATPTAPVPAEPTALSLNASYYSTCIIPSAANALCWGDHRSRQLGFPSFDGGATATSTPYVPPLPAGLTRMAINRDFGCSISAGAVSCFGNNQFGEVGTDAGGARPPTTNGVTSAVELATSLAHACALTSTGDVYCWGLNTFGEVGHNPQIDDGNHVAFAPMIVAGLPAQ